MAPTARRIRTARRRQARLRAELGNRERRWRVRRQPYGPNDDAADFLIDTLAPRLPGLTIGIAGASAPLARAQPRPQGAGQRDLFGIVEHETLPRSTRADIGLNPMRHGSGTNIKMLDYMAAGWRSSRRPSARAGCRENRMNMDLNRRAVSDPAGSTSGLTRAARAAWRGARRLAETDYDWPIISGKLAEALRKLVHKKPSV